MNHCPDPESWRAALSSVLDGEDPPVARERLDEHLDACAECAAWVERARAQRSLLQAAPGPHRDLTAHLVGVTEAHICACHTGGECRCTACVCPTCTCHEQVS
ncbi:zf-HC2 domain-containing protein [Luteococcus peritonei]|uniref:Zf-HC2 domain-containing protein n=1 Tax=Luteococcus peritonei TaxID=88874 RepID=A0ABW4RU16_9ACTN